MNLLTLIISLAGIIMNIHTLCNASSGKYVIIVSILIAILCCTGGWALYSIINGKI